MFFTSSKISSAGGQSSNIQEISQIKSITLLFKDLFENNLVINRTFFSVITF